MDQPPQPTGLPQPPLQPQIVPEPRATPPPRKSRVLGPAVRGLSGARAAWLAGAERAAVVVVGLSGLGGVGRARAGCRRILLPQPLRRRQGGHPLDRGHDPQRRRLLQASDRPRQERHRGWQSEGDRGPRQLARRHDHRQRLHAPPPPQTGRRHATFPWWSAWAGSPPAAAITCRCAWATSPRPSSPSRPPGPARSA